MEHFIDVALAIVRQEGRWLVSRRAPGRVFAGLWEFPGGKVETGEPPGQTAVREMREETGLTVAAEPVAGVIETRHGGCCWRLHLIPCRLIGGRIAPDGQAVTHVRWVTDEELRELPMPPANREIVTWLLNRSDREQPQGHPG